ncbi:MAG: hypothetical protein B6D37_11685, partial [Sphingobacteriales bacterium UTBCD1]
MNKEIHSIIRNLQNVLDGAPWYGKPVFTILHEIDPRIVYKKPALQDGRPNAHSHSIAELLYHMITWTEFCWRQVEKADKKLVEEIQSRDWRDINPSVHNWQQGLEELRTLHDHIIAELESKEDEWLKEKVHSRNYNYRFMLNGLIQHNIYHIGQIAYVNKLFSSCFPRWV